MPLLPCDSAASIGMLADDLTGALDTAANFAPMVFIADPATAALPNRSVLNTSTREVTSEQAVIEAVTANAGYVRSCDIVFLKIDSLLRGPIGAMLLAMYRSSMFDRCLIAPALPAQDRRTLCGRLMVRQGNDYVVSGPDLTTEMRDRGIPVANLHSGSKPEADWAQIADASSIEHLSRHIQACSEAGGKTLYCGSAGLARAIAVTDPMQRGISGPLLLVIGSYHDVSRAQVSELQAAGLVPIVQHTFGQDPLRIVSIVDAALTEGRSIALTFDFAETTDRLMAHAEIGTVLAALAELRQQPSSLMIVGGETLAQAVRILCVERIIVNGEVRPGVPHSTMVGGPWHGTTLVSKSGAFGPPDLLLSTFAEATNKPCSQIRRPGRPRAAQHW